MIRSGRQVVVAAGVGIVTQGVRFVGALSDMPKDIETPEQARAVIMAKAAKNGHIAEQVRPFVFHIV